MARRIRHLPLSMWLRHPVHSGAVAFLARRGPQDHAEIEHEAHGQAAASRVVGRRGRRIGRLCERSMTAAIRATRHLEIALIADDRPHVLGGKRSARHANAEKGWSATGRTARRDLVSTLRTIQRDQDAGVTVHQHSRSSMVTAFAYVLLAVDAVALFAVFSLLLNIDWAAPATAPLVTAAAFSVFGAGVQAKLAVELGKRIWSWRVASAHRVPDGLDPHDPAEEFPPRGFVVAVSATVLGLVSVFAALSILLRVRHEGELVGQVGVATVVGLVLAGCAIAAPWILVQQEAFDGSPLTRRAGALTRIVQAADGSRYRALRLGDRDIAKARRLDARARRHYGRVELRVGQCYARRHRAILLARELGSVDIPSPRPDSTPPRAALPIRVPVDLGYLTTALDQSDSAIEEARAARAALTARLSPPAERFDPELYMS